MSLWEIICLLVKIVGKSIKSDKGIVSSSLAVITSTVMMLMNTVHEYCNFTYTLIFNDTLLGIHG